MGQEAELKKRLREVDSLTDSIHIIDLICMDENVRIQHICHESLERQKQNFQRRLKELINLN